MSIIILQARHTSETSTPLLSSNKRTSKVDPYIKPVMYIIIGCAFLASISFLTAHYSTMKEVVDYSAVKEREQITKGSKGDKKLAK
jgi:hypothetical protein